MDSKNIYFACLFVRDGAGHRVLHLAPVYGYEAPIFAVGADPMALYRELRGSYHIYELRGRTGYLVILAEWAEQKKEKNRAPKRLNLSEHEREYLVNVCWEMVTNPDASYVDTLLGIGARAIP